MRKARDSASIGSDRKQRLLAEKLLCPKCAGANALFSFEVCFAAANGLFLTESCFLIDLKKP